MKKKTFISFLFSFIALNVQAQDLAKFTVNYNKVCLGTAIQVTDLSAGGNGDAMYQFGDGTTTTPPDANPSHTYATINTFNLRQFLPISGTVIDPQTGNLVGYVTYTLPITVVDNADLLASYSSLSNNEVQFIVNDTRFDSYEVDFGDGSALTSVNRNTSGSSTFFNHTFPSSMEYSVSVKVKFSAGNTCPNADITFPVTPPLMSANDIPSPDKNSINIYPNPLKQGESIYFTSSSFITTKLIVYNSSGNEVFESDDHNSIPLSSANLSPLQPGLYMVHMLNNQNARITRQLMIK